VFYLQFGSWPTQADGHIVFDNGSGLWAYGLGSAQLQGTLVGKATQYSSSDNNGLMNIDAASSANLISLMTRYSTVLGISTRGYNGGIERFAIYSYNLPVNVPMWVAVSWSTSAVYLVIATGKCSAVTYCYTNSGVTMSSLIPTRYRVGLEYGGYPFHGEVDETRWYTNAMTTSEIIGSLFPDMPK
jgi:hypothetical protein